VALEQVRSNAAGSELQGPPPVGAVAKGCIGGLKTSLGLTKANRRGADRSLSVRSSRRDGQEVPWGT